MRYGPTGCTSRIIRTMRIAIPSIVRQLTVVSNGKAYTGISRSMCDANREAYRGPRRVGVRNRGKPLPLFLIEIACLLPASLVVRSLTARARTVGQTNIE